MKAWHFLKEDMRAEHGRLGLIEVGKTYTVKGEISLCKKGFHASTRLIDALDYAPGPVLCRVEMGGEIIKGDDKVVASERTVLWMQDISETLHKFACDEAHRSLTERRNRGEEPDERSWNAIKAKRLWLQGKATDALDAARAPAWAPAWAAARAAAWAAARDAARDAAKAAARDAAKAAAWAAAWDAAWDAARDAARDAQNKRLTARVMRLMK